MTDSPLALIQRERIRRERMGDAEETVSAIIRDVCDLDGYTSPDDNPDLLQCTVKELTLILRRRILGEE